MTIDFKAMAAQVAATGPDMTKAVKGGGGDYTPPAAGPCRLRLVGYIEVGQHEKTYAGKDTKREDTAWLVFELSGKNHPVKVLDDGSKMPIRITVKLNRSMNEKAAFFKLFRRMNYKGEASHMSQLLGEAFRGTVVHSVVGEGDKKRTYANLKDDSGFTIQPPRYEDPESGEVRDLPVDPPISEMRLFVWNAEPKFLAPMWSSLFIDGTYGEGENQRSRNVFQDEIKAAVNYVGSPIYNLLQAGGLEPDLPGASIAPVAQPAGDPLDNL